MTKRERDPELPSTTQRVDTGWGKIYVTIAEDDGDPFEVFVNTGMSGGLFNAQAEAIGKTVSVALRMAEDRGAAAEELADKLIGIRSDKVAMDSGDNILSVPDAIGIALRRHVRGMQGMEVRDVGDMEKDPEP